MIVIKLDDGSILTEGAAILQYIADRNPDSGLAPKAGTMERYRLQEWLTFIGTEIHNSFSPLFNKAASADVRKYASDLLTKRPGYVETQLANKPYLMGKRFTVADAYMFVVVNWNSHVGIDLGQFPRIQEYVHELRAPCRAGGDEGRRLDSVALPLGLRDTNDHHRTIRVAGISGSLYGFRQIKVVANQC